MGCRRNTRTLQSSLERCCKRASPRKQDGPAAVLPSRTHTSPLATEGDPQALGHPPWQGLVSSALGRRGKPSRRYWAFQREQSMRRVFHSHSLFAAWGMAATELGCKLSDSKIHSKGVVCFILPVSFYILKKIMFLLSLAE